MPDANSNNDTGLVRRLGLPSATLAGLGVILGSGIYVLVGVAAGEAGNAVWLSFLVAAVAAGLTGLSYARLGRLRPKNAPEFQYLDMAFGRRPAFLAGWLVLWATVISTAAVALGFAGYLYHLLDVPILLGAIGLVLASSLVAFLGIGESMLLAIMLTVPTVAGLLVIIVIGLPHLGDMDPLEMPVGISGVVSAASLVFFAYLGFEGMANLSEEMRNPERDLPRAIILALGISTLLYILVSLAAVSVLGWRGLSQTPAPLAAVAAQVFGARADLAISLMSLAATSSTALILLLTASRAMWAMSCAGALPMTFCVIGKNHRTPWLTIILVTVFASLFAAFRNIGEVAEFTNFAVLLAFAGVNASAIKILKRETSGGRLRHATMDIALPALGGIASLWLAANTGWRAALLGLALLVAGVLAYWAMGARSRGRIDPPPEQSTERRERGKGS